MSEGPAPLRVAGRAFDSVSGAVTDRPANFSLTAS